MWTLSFPAGCSWTNTGFFSLFFLVQEEKRTPQLFFWKCKPTVFDFIIYSVTWRSEITLSLLLNLTKLAAYSRFTTITCSTLKQDLTDLGQTITIITSLFKETTFLIKHFLNVGFVRLIQWSPNKGYLLIYSNPVVRNMKRQLCQVQQILKGH